MLTLAEEDARAAGLRYVDDGQPGITRTRLRSRFKYFAGDGKEVTDEKILERIRKLAIPPAYEHVWICAFSNGHLQATGRDARGRKQYRYHAAWRDVRDANKFAQTIAFAEMLPRVRERVEHDLAHGDARQKLLAAVVKLLETTHIRVGNDEYAKSNASYGLTTLRTKHVKVQGAKLRFSFKGKSGVAHAISLEDRRLAKIVRRCQDLPGEELFGYENDDGEITRVRSDDVNEYVREIAGEAFSAKDFRTWHGTVVCALELERLGEAGSVAEAKRRLNEALDRASSELGNTRSVCRKCYVHPAVSETYLDDLRLDLPAGRKSKTSSGLSDGERRVLAFLKAEGRKRDGALTERLAKSLEKRRVAK